MIIFLFIIIPFLTAGCQTTLGPPTAVATLTVPPVFVQELRPTNPPRVVATRDPALPTSTLAPAFLEPALTPIATATLPASTLLVGHSVAGRGIIARRVGNGPRTVMVVGGIHGGWEANTVRLVNELIAYFEDNSQILPPEFSLLLVPVANPDGLIRGQTEAGRFNANGVDLNRNWGCEWSRDAVWRNQPVDAGPEPFSEPETRALSAFIQNTRPETVLFYHSAAGGVFAGECEVDHGSAEMSQILGQATGYTHGQAFSAYKVTGTAASWVDGLGIPSADVELLTVTDSEFQRNLAGLLAIIDWLAR